MNTRRFEYSASAYSISRCCASLEIEYEEEPGAMAPLIPEETTMKVPSGLSPSDLM